MNLLLEKLLNLFLVQRGIALEQQIIQNKERVDNLNREFNTLITTDPILQQHAQDADVMSLITQEGLTWAKAQLLMDLVENMNNPTLKETITKAIKDIEVLQQGVKYSKPVTNAEGIKKNAKQAVQNIEKN